jgi:hypothetical protein
MSTDNVLLVQDANGNVFAIPENKLADAKVNIRNAKVKEAMKKADPSKYKALGIAVMPQSVRKAVYATPNISANVSMPMPTA